MGTAFEWYDFFLFGTLASIIARNFTAAARAPGLSSPWAPSRRDSSCGRSGAVLRPHGGPARPQARLSHDHLAHGRRRPWRSGCCPTMAQVGIAAPILLVTLRVLQGFAMGGEYGGAAVYVAEHARPDRRGFLTSWIQVTAAARRRAGAGHGAGDARSAGRSRLAGVGLARALPAVGGAAGAFRCGSVCKLSGEPGLPENAGRPGESRVRPSRKRFGAAICAGC